MGWRPNYNTTDSGQRDGAVNEDREIEFYVDVPAHMAHDPFQVVNASQGFQIPVNRGDPHPRNAAGILDVYAEDFNVTKQTGDSCVLRAVYTTDGAAYNQNIAIQRRAHRREASFRKVETKIPFIREVRSKRTGAPAAEPGIPGFEVDFLTIYETQPVIQIQVTLTALTDDDVRKIDVQDGALHLIGATGLPGAYIRPARFEAGDIVQHGPGKWKVLYTWYTDKGTRAGKMAGKGDNFGGPLGEPFGLPNPIVYGPPPGVGQPDNRPRQYRPPENPNMLTATGQNGVGLPYGDTNKYIRSPFHEIHYILHTDLPPEFTQFCPFRVESDPASGPINGLGWKLLPGGPLP